MAIVHAADADDDVDDALPAEASALADALVALLVAVPEERPRVPARARAGTSRSDDPDQDPAERLLGELAQGARAERRARPVAEGELDGQPADQHVDDAVRDQAGAGDPVDPVAVRRGRRAQTRWRGGRSGRRRSSTPERGDRDLRVDRDGQEAEDLAARRADGRRADQHAAIGVLDHLDQSVPTRAVGEAARTTPPAWCCPCGPSARRRGPAASVIPTPATSGSVKVTCGTRVVARRRAVLAEDVAQGDRRSGTSTRA